MVSAPTPLPDPSRCPLCGGDNRCAMEIERETGTVQPPCWCMDATFTPELFQRIPAEARGQACICAACVAAALREAEAG